MSDVKKYVSIPVTCCLLLIVVVFATVHADDEVGVEKKGVDKGSLKAAGEGKGEAEAMALVFAEEHHPELKTLVESLKSANPDGYKKAIHDLARTHDRLAKLQANRNLDRYRYELALWKLDSRIRLTAARSAMTDTDELRAELRTLVEQRQALTLQWLRDDHKRTAVKLAKLEADVQAAEAQKSQAVDAEVDRLLKSVKAKKPEVAANLKKETSKKPGKGEAKPKGKTLPPGKLPKEPPVEPKPAVVP